ncbi:YceI family protein [Govanella unica]|uniref:YceI family protein n=1 Tax=Govanella unica TaxID=2975056 RepID=A0A9X3TXF9_9PROT|nr:YceI family protein [Govania unica]MDA5193541.1 YceI family protein [Govania unica]
MIARLMIAAVMLWPLAAGAAEWRVIAKDSHLGFQGTQAGSSFDGIFPAFDAAIRFDPDHLDQASVTVTIDLSKAESGNADRDSALGQPEWFHVKTYPTAQFVSQSFRKTAADQYEASGKLTLKGVTHQIVLPFTLKITGAVAHMTGAVTLNRHDFNVGEGQWGSDQWVGKDVVVTVKLTAERAGN